MSAPPLPPVETFPKLDAMPQVRAAFLTRVPGIDVNVDRESALAALRDSHEQALDRLGFPPRACAKQVHGNEIAVVERPDSTPIPGVDGLITQQPDLTLGIYVADCAAIYLVDPVVKAIALLHSGKKGTELNILANAVGILRDRFGSNPADLVAVVSPCIRPPHYEIDFAATIADQARACGVGTFADAGTCTASDPDRYYSYRREKGKTGRLLAVLALRG